MAVYGSLGEYLGNLWQCLREVYGSLGKSMESLQQSREVLGSLGEGNGSREVYG